MWRVEADNSEEPSFLGIIRDISRRRQTEVELRQSEARLQVMLASTLDPMITITGHGLKSYLS